jgi:sodium transport system ATP-binding protein
MIVVENVAKSFGQVHAVQSVSFTALDGQITGLLGPNGAGKSTTIRMMYGLLRPDLGRVEVDGFDPSRQPVEARKCLGALPDAYGLYPRLTARENIAYFGRLQGMSGAQLNRRIDELNDLLDMNEILSRRVDGFSQGQRMKVSIARAIVHNPKNVILDEPTNGLDVMTTRAMRTLIRRMKDAGCCVILSSHIMQEVSALCDEIAVIASGKVVATGNVADFCARTGEADLEEAFVKLVCEE